MQNQEKLGLDGRLYRNADFGAGKEGKVRLQRLYSMMLEVVSLPTFPIYPISENAALAAAAAAAVAMTLGYSLWRLNTPKSSFQSAKPLPQPPSLPILGNAHHIGANSFKCFDYWARKLGPILQFDVGTEHWVIVSDYQIAYEICSKRGVLYNSRPTNNHFIGILTDGFKSLISCPYGEEWRKLRRIFIDAIGSRRLPKYQEYIDNEVTHLIANIGKTKQQATSPLPLIQLFTYNVIIKLLVDQRFDDAGDPWIVREMEIGEQTSAFLSPTGNPVHVFPILGLLPRSWVGYKEEDVLAVKAEALGRFEIMIAKLRQRLGNGEDVQCFCRDILEKEAEGEMDHDEVLQLMGVTITAGYETTAATITWWIAEIANRADIQAKLYTELRQTLGSSEKLPTYEEALRMPYLIATIREAMRLHPAGPLGLPHLVMDDDIYEGYHIPKDNAIMLNIYAMNRDPKRFEDHNVFKPERYLNVRQLSSTLANGRSEDRDHTSFGFGRRVCAGMQLAERELLTVTSAIVSSFSLEPVDGPIDTENFKLGITMKALPYNVKFVPRS
ncbi:hypothetical protein BZG36_05455 [Bifiguratus adelaidae]|uniref:Cytochrome P450 n=1 Tax=Bifiguratus adelaidae TaxID=1938954 RepID=A0A261XTR6_9FUNG|nr:hypothetical protein BZG36_05455 [Bifiguratus adelaidae]